MLEKSPYISFAELEGFPYKSKKREKRSYSRRLSEILFSFAPWAFLLPNHREGESAGMRGKGLRHLKRLFVFIDNSEPVVSESEFQEIYELAEMVPGPTVLQLAAGIACVHGGFTGVLLASFLVVLPSAVISFLVAAAVMWWQEQCEFEAGAVIGAKAVLAGLLLERALRLHELYVADVRLGHVFHSAIVAYLVLFLDHPFFRPGAFLWYPLMLGLMWRFGDAIARTPSLSHSPEESVAKEENNREEGHLQTATCTEDIEPLDPERDRLVDYGNHVGLALLALAFVLLIFSYLCSYLSPEFGRYEKIVRTVCSFMRASVFGGCGQGEWVEALPVLMGEHEVGSLLEGFVLVLLLPGHSRLASAGAACFCATLSFLRAHPANWRDHFHSALGVSLVTALISQVVGIVAMLSSMAFWAELREPEKCIASCFQERFRIVRAAGPGFLTGAALTLCFSIFEPSEKDKDFMRHMTRERLIAAAVFAVLAIRAYIPLGKKRGWIIDRTLLLTGVIVGALIDRVHTHTRCITLW